MLTSRYRRFASIAALGVACAAALAVLSRDVSSADRIDPSDVTFLNMEIFKEQVRHDLPIGTAKQEVEAYLNRQNITHHFAPNVPVIPDRNTFYALIQDIGPWFFVMTHLQILVRLDDKDTVREIGFRLSY